MKAGLIVGTALSMAVVGTIAVLLAWQPSSASPAEPGRTIVPVPGTFVTVMEDQTTGWDTTGISSPFVLYDGGLYKMWYGAASGPWPSRQVLAYATSSDGITWSNQQVVHDSGSGDYMTGSPQVIKEGGAYKMWHSDYYEEVAGDWSAYLAYMTSTDGVTWPTFMSGGDQKVLSAQGQSSPQGDGYSIGHASVMHEPSGYVTWYSVADHPQPGQGGPTKIWRATSPDGITWSNRQLSLPYVPGTWEGNVLTASVVKEADGSYTMFYWAYSADPADGGIGIAWSSDGITWSDRRLLLNASDLAPGIVWVGQPFHFTDVDGKRYLYFRYYDGRNKFGRVQVGEDADGDGLANAVETNTGIFIDSTDTGTDPLNPDTDGDGLGDGAEVLMWHTNPLVVDTDRDGCSDGEELGPNKHLGGQRDPLNPYDFYDITNSTFVVGARDKAVSPYDLSMLLSYGGTSDGGPCNSAGKCYDDDKNGNGIDDGREIDFASIHGPASGPDGAISAFDLSALLTQGGNSCVAPP